ncbi:MAG: hypothetical protein AAGF76_10020 [Pseudomonadota bacterium]
MTASRPSQRRLTIRLTPDEYAALEREAKGRPLAGHVRARLFGSQTNASKSRANAKAPRKDHALAAKILGLLGRQTPLQHLSTLANAARSGSLDVTPEVLVQIDAAFAAIRDIKAMLMRTHGISER